MDEQKIKKMEEEIDALLEKVHEDPYVANTPLPERLERNIKKSIHAMELEKIERAIDEELAKGEALIEEEANESSNVVEFPRETMSAEDKELIRLGKIYKKKQKLHKYLVAAAVAIFVLALGVTSIGGPEKVFETFRFFVSRRNMTQTNSGDDVEFVENITEEEVYQKIEDEFGFYPVKPIYRPEGIQFLEAQIGEEIKGINMLYGSNNNVELAYFIYPNHRNGSLSTDVEDDLVEKYERDVNGVIILIKKYVVEGQKNNRWSVEFTYQNVQYFIRITEMEKDEVEKIVENLFFS